MYTVICWPDVQELFEVEGFEDNSYLISDERGIRDFGPSAYFVDVKWLNDLEN